MKKAVIYVETLSPVVLSAENNSTVMTETKEFFSGTVLRGVLAARYIQQQKLGGEAHRDETFRQLFFGGIRFVDAYPICAGKRSMPLPLSLQKSKEDGSLLDLMSDKAASGYKTMKGFGAVSAGTIVKAEVRRRVALHMSRSAEHERLTGRSLNGGIYNYEAIETGQQFAGELIGEKELLEKLLQGLRLQDDSMECYIGRSKYTEYGHCKMEVKGIATLPEALFKGQSVFLRLDTAVLSWAGQVERAEEILQPFVDQLNQAAGREEFSLGGIIATGTAQENFVGVWNMKRPVRYGLAAGSIFELKKASDWTKAEKEQLQQEIYKGFGAGTEEGFGQLRVWNIKAMDLQTGKSNAMQKAKQNEMPERRTVRSQSVTKAAEAILMKRILERVRMQAFQDTEELGSKLKGATHVFARLESMLGEKKDLVDAEKRFHIKLQEELREKSPLEMHLKKITLDGRPLLEILSGEAEMPYAHVDWSEEISTELADDIGFELPKAGNGSLFYEYWLWFFRHARKQATRKGDEK